MHPDLALLAVDTLARAGDVDENSAELGRIAEFMHQIAEEFDVAVIVVHHSGKDVAKGARGHSSLRAAVDTEIRVEVEKDASDKVVRRWFTVSKQREAEQGLSREFQLYVTEVGVDEDGETITGIWAGITGGEIKHAPRARGPQGKWQVALFDALGYLLSKVSGHEVREDLPGVPHAVLLGDVLREAQERVPMDPQKRDRRREYLTRAAGELQSNGLIRITTEEGIQWVGMTAKE